MHTCLRYIRHTTMRVGKLQRTAQNSVSLAKKIDH